MADKYPNVPGIVVEQVESRLAREQAALGPTPVVLGTAGKGPAGEEIRVFSGPAAVSKYGVSGSLGRGLAEAFQGGADNAFGFRILATKGHLSHVGDVLGADGMTIEPVVAGSDALEKYEILYGQDNDELKVYEVSTGDLVYHKTGATVSVDQGHLNVSGSMASGNDADFKAGSIGLQVAVATDETLQTFNEVADATPAVITIVAAAGLNLNILQFSSTTNPYVAQLLDSADAVVQEVEIASVSAAGPTVTLTAASADLNAAFTANGSTGHKIRFVSTLNPIRMDRVVTNRVGVGGSTELRMLPGSDFNGLAKLVNDEGAEFDSAEAEVEPAKMNLYEALCDAGLALEATDFDHLVLMDAYADDPALDGQDLPGGETILPGALFGQTSTATIAKKKDQLNLLFTNNSDQAAARVKLDLAGRGGCWLTVTEPKNDDFGAEITADELVRSARILNWEEAGEVSTVECVADVAGSLNNKYWTFDDGDGLYYVWYNINAEGIDPVGAGTGIEVAGATGATAVTLAAATADAITASAALVTASDLLAVVTLTNTNTGLAVDAADSAAATDFTIEVGVQGTNLLMHLDRDLSFSLDVNDLVEAGLDPTVVVRETDLLFFHREKEVSGELLHMWYTAKIDPDGYSYNEVNFAWKLAKTCKDISENEKSVIGSIGVRPPSNHFNPASLSTWIGKSPSYDSDGEVSVNGSGLLGWKFVSGRALDDVVADQFSAGFLLTDNEELDGTESVLDSNGYEVDLGKFISIVAAWPIMSNVWDSAGAGYIASGAALYAGLLCGLAPWSGSTAKRIGGSNIRLPRSLAKRHQDSLTGARFVVMSEKDGVVTVVDGPSAALPVSDYTRNMTMRLVAEAVDRSRTVARPFLGDPLDALKKIGLETQIKRALSELQSQSGGALESFSMGLTQTNLDKARGTAKLSLALKVINELRKISVSVALTL